VKNEILTKILKKQNEKINIIIYLLFKNFDFQESQFNFPSLLNNSNKIYKKNMKYDDGMYIYRTME